MAKTLEDWVTLPQAAERWGVSRAWTWRLVSEYMEVLPDDVVTRAGDRWMLEPGFVQAVAGFREEGLDTLEAIKAYNDERSFGAHVDEGGAHGGR